ncbi:MFS transporter [Streptosporangium sp. NBC_01755]|uniref:MFS transporter n=1 Tax=unclassified Streptosporangium TaxID=2632669 RepID=UPI002DD9F61F|nr:MULTISPECIES: MFS transporter [unclassified Streptosporangium]WSA28414.1 MFS transporter [Streptosporangium sp. NBC_01810]WSD00096.1 MFS transporter [Streptosporangium sp. NBC_01755]
MSSAAEPATEAATEAAAPAPGGGGQPRSGRGWRIVAALAVTQTIGYGVLYYAFSVFLTPMTADLHVSSAQVAAALTGSILIAALCAPLVGRLLDARGGRGLMTAGSVIGTLAVLAWSQVENLAQLYAVFAAIGIASAMVLYESAFAVIVSWFDGPDHSQGHGRANALLALTVVAGFASTIFLPLTGLLVDAYGWRTALVVLAAIYGVAAIPLHALVVRRPARAGRRAATTRERAEIVKAATRRRPFWLLVIAFTANGGAVAVMAVLLITYLIHLGHSPVLAATLAGLLGVLSVTGRLLTTGLQRRLPAALIAAAIFALQGVAAALLPPAGRTVPGAIGCVLGFGLGFGIASITLPHLLLQRYGTSAYASLSGRVAAFSVADKALAPLGAVALAQAAGYTCVMAAVAVACAVAAFALVAYHRV